MPDPDFWDFLLDGGWELLFPDSAGKEVTCLSCGRVINGDELVEWVDKKRGIFKCPECQKEVKIK